MERARLSPGIRARAAAQHRARVVEFCRPLRCGGMRLWEICVELNRAELLTFEGYWRPHYLARLLPPEWTAQARDARRRARAEGREEGQR